MYIFFLYQLDILRITTSISTQYLCHVSNTISKYIINVVTRLTAEIKELYILSIRQSVKQKIEKSRKHLCTI